jgi:APA family basic amino acid/polyamine antiporter
VPLIVFAAAGLFALDPAAPSPWTAPEAAGLQQASLILMFAFGGFEMAVIPGGEIINPRRNIPIAMLVSIAIVVVLYVLIQLVAQGTLPEPASSATPLASASARFLGPAGAALVTLGAVLSTSGTTSGVMLTAPRMIFAMGEGGNLPALFGRVHPRFRTPHAAVVATALIGWLFAMFSQFSTMAAVSALARLVTYIGVCLSLPVLRRTMPDGGFRVPAGTAVAVAATAISLWLLMGSTRTQFLMGGGAFLIGALIYAASSGLTKPS